MEAALGVPLAPGGGHGVAAVTLCLWRVTPPARELRVFWDGF